MADEIIAELWKIKDDIVEEYGRAAKAALVKNQITSAEIFASIVT